MTNAVTCALAVHWTGHVVLQAVIWSANAITILALVVNRPLESIVAFVAVGLVAVKAQALALFTKAGFCALVEWWTSHLFDQAHIFRAGSILITFSVPSMIVALRRRVEAGVVYGAVRLRPYENRLAETLIGPR